MVKVGQQPQVSRRHSQLPSNLTPNNNNNDRGERLFVDIPETAKSLWFDRVCKVEAFVNKGTQKSFSSQKTHNSQTVNMRFSFTFVALLIVCLMFSVTAFTASRAFARANHHAQQQQRLDQSTRLFMNIFRDLFASPDVASPDDVRAAFEQANVIVIDVRSPTEITTKVDAKRWMNAPGTPFDCPDLKSSGLLPDDKSTPIIVYCASGKRSQKAKMILQEQGYTSVWNAGGIEQVATYLPIINAAVK